MSDPSLFDTWISQAGLNELFNPQKTVTAMRDAMARMEELVEVAPPPVEAIHDIEVSGGAGARPARVYLPYGAQPDSGPGLIFYHGGGFMVGSLKSHDPLCRRLAAVSGVRICSVDYRLAPEHGSYPVPRFSVRARLLLFIQRQVVYQEGDCGPL